MQSNFLNKLILIFLISSGVLFSILGLKTDAIKKVKEYKPIVTEVKGVETKSQNTPQPVVAKQVKKTVQVVPTPSPTSLPSSSPVQNTPSPATTPVSTPVPVVTDQVTLSINGESSFAIFVNQGSNQCDVLNAAFSQGKISSLNMRYDKAYETNAVYQINGIGKENSVWWVYTINGNSATQGCSHIKVNNNDNIEWKYIGS